MFFSSRLKLFKWFAGIFIAVEYQYQNQSYSKRQHIVIKYFLLTYVVVWYLDINLDSAETENLLVVWESY